LPDWAAAMPLAHESPRTGIEQAMAGIWERLLHRGGLRRDDHFFELGGHSLLAVQLVNRIREQWGVSLPLRCVFDSPTLAGLAQQVDALRAGDAAGADQIPLADRSQPLPLSLAQQRLWFLDQMTGLASAYVIPVALRLDGGLNTTALSLAFEALIARHESLRTVFPTVDDQATQQVLPHSGFQLLMRDASDAPNGDAELAEAQARQAILAAPFDLACGPLLRACVLRLGADSHLLLVAMHHIISDGWSMGVAVRDLVALYLTHQAPGAERLPAMSDDGALAGALPPLPVQYADFAVWQRRSLAGDALSAQASFWRDALAGAPAFLTLPADRPRPAQPSHAAQREAVALGAALTADLTHCAQRHGLTLHMLLLSAWALLMARLSGQDDVVIGTPVANRPRAELNDLIGFFVNTLPLRLRPQGNPDLRSWLNEVKASTLAAYAHQDLPFDQIVEAIQPPRSLAHAPVFQVLFSLNNTPATSAQLPGLTVTPLPVPAQHTQFDLALSLQEHEGDVVGTLDYAAELFEPDTIQRWLGHWAVLLQAIAAAPPDQPCQTLAWLAQADLAQVLRFAQSDDTTEPCVQLSVLERFAQQVQRQPDACALTFKEQDISYAELNRRSDALAEALWQQGTARQDLVAVLMPRGIEMVVAVLGTLKAGAAYLPLDPGYPTARLRFMLDDARPRLLLTEASLRGVADAVTDRLRPDEALRADEMPADPVDHITLRSLAFGERLLLSSADTSDAAYVIYTSGSTGLPKGVVLTYKGLDNLAAWQAGQFKVGPGSRVLQFASFSFDACTWEWVMALCHGATLCLAEPEALTPGQALHHTLATGRITHATLPPVALSAMAAQTATQDPSGSIALPELQTLTVAGEACPPAVVRTWSRGRRFFNAYGPTETTICATVHACHDTVLTDTTPIGRPIAGAQVHVLDADGRPQPIGVTGEVYIGGVGVARGYLNRPELNAERFLPDPFASQSGARLYRTGDLGCWRADGALVYLGRNDHQVKLRGLRIELGEIEACLRRQPGVQDAHVLAASTSRSALGDDCPDQTLVAFVVPHATEGTTDPDHAALQARLHQALRTELPAHMLPGTLVPLPSLPLTSNGKVDRTALLALGTSARLQLNTVTADSAPRSDTERALCLLWQDTLGLDAPCGRHADFFALGGHSLSAARLMGRVQALGIQLPLAQLFQHPTPALLAAAAEAAPQGASAHTNAPTLALRPQGHKPPLFLVHELSGTALPYLALSRLIEADRPVHALVLPDLSAPDAGPIDALAQLAARHAKAIQQVQAQGPYHLAGWSAGGVLALATAEQLIERGEQVAYLGLIDAPCPEAEPTSLSRPPEAHTPREVLLAHLASASDLEDPQQRAQLQRWAAPHQPLDLETIVDEARLAGLLPAHLGRQETEARLAQASALAQAIQHHRIAPLPLTLHCIAASQEGPAQVRRWREALPGRVIVQTVDASHWTILRAPAVDTVAEHINRALQSKVQRPPLPAKPAMVAKRPAPSASPLVVIQAGIPSETTVVCIPGAGAHVTCFVPLVQALGQGVPVYGMQPRGLDGEADPFQTVEETAAAGVQALLALKLDKPLTLVGHSFGGWIAYDMARQWQEAGKPVRSLVLLDSAPPSAKGAGGRQFDRLDATMELVRLLAQQAGRPLKLHRQDMRQLNEQEQVDALHRAMVQAGLLRASSAPDNVAHLVRVFQANLNTRYMPSSRLDVTTLIFSASDTTGHRRQNRAAPWRQFTPHARLQTMSGNHVTMLNSPHVDIVAARLLEPRSTEAAQNKPHGTPLANTTGLQGSHN
jgi:amino acid adenylation domain-containing protein